MLYWIARHIFQFYFFLLYHNKVYGKKPIVHTKCIIAPNHASFLDPPLIAASWPSSATFLARKTLFDPPFLEKILGWLNTYPVGGATEDLSSLKLVCQLLQNGKAVVIFPEGTRTVDGELQSIKPGIGMLAMRNHADIIPTYIHGTFEIWPRTQKYPSWTGHTACVFGSPIRWEEFQHLPRKEAYENMAERTRLALAELKKWYENGASGTPP